MPLAPTGDWALVGHPTDRNSPVYIRRPLKTSDAPMGNLAPRALRPWQKVGVATTYSDEDMSQLMERDGLVPLFPGMRYPAFTEEDLEEEELDDLLMDEPSREPTRLPYRRPEVTASDFTAWTNALFNFTFPPSQITVVGASNASQ